MAASSSITTSWTRRVVRALAAALLTLGVLVAAVGSVQAQPEEPADDAPVYLADISGVIDLGLAPYLQRAIDEAEEAGAAALVMDIDTPGGSLEAVLQMRDTLMAAQVPTIAFVNPTAFSAGALITIAANEIYMAPSGVMGAATPVTGEGVEGGPKVIAATRSTFRSTAEERGRDPQVAAAMVDSNLEVDGLVSRGELVALTTSDAEEWGYTDGVATSLEEVLEQAGLTGSPIVQADQSWAEGFVRFITNPVLAGLFLMAGWLLVIGDLSSGGVGAGTALGSGFLAVFFWGHLLAGLAGWEDVVLVVLGVVLILVELLVVPGFGVFGILGLVSLLGGSYLAMLGRDFDFVGTDQMVQSGVVVGAAFVAVCVLLVVFVRFLTRREGPPGLVLRTQLASTTPATQRTSGWLGWFGDGGVLEAEPRPGAAPRPADGDAEVEHDERDEAAGVATAQRAGLLGATGVALSDLRPSGVADIDGRRVDVVTDGEYIRAGDLVEIVGDEGYRRVVRRVRD